MPLPEELRFPCHGGSSVDVDIQGLLMATIDRHHRYQTPGSDHSSSFAQSRSVMWGRVCLSSILSYKLSCCPRPSLSRVLTSLRSYSFLPTLTPPLLLYSEFPSIFLTLLPLTAIYFGLLTFLNTSGSTFGRLSEHRRLVALNARVPHPPPLSRPRRPHHPQLLC